MPDYNEGKIYLLKSKQTDKVYVGSTTQSLAKRMRGHRNIYQENISTGDKSGHSSLKLLKYDDVYIRLLEEYPCESRKELTMREGYWIKNYKGRAVNFLNAGTGTGKDWYENNKDMHNKCTREWYANNKDKHHALSKNYYEEHKQQLSEKRKAQREAKSNYVTCECGVKCKEYTLRYHIKTKGHQNYLHSK